MSIINKNARRKSECKNTDKGSVRKMQGGTSRANSSHQAFLKTYLRTKSESQEKRLP